MTRYESSGGSRAPEGGALDECDATGRSASQHLPTNYNPTVYSDGPCTKDGQSRRLNRNAQDAERG